MNEQIIQQQLLAAIRAALHAQKVNIEPLSDELAAYAKRHKVLNMLYLATGHPKLKQYYKAFVAQAAAQENFYEQLEQAFEARQVYVLPVKGIQTAKRYPKAELRSMNDIDVLCKAEQDTQLKELMEHIGYDKLERGRKHDLYLKTPHIALEVHKDLIDAENSLYYDYFQNVWNRAVPKSGKAFVFEMKLEDEYVYNIVHLANHFAEGGAGLRFFADIYVYEHLEFQREYFQKQLSELKLTRFYQNVRALAYCWFGTKQERESIVITPLLQNMGSFVLAGGLFGSISRTNHISAKRGKLSVLRQNLFPNYASMKSMFPWLKPIGLPLAWALRATGAFSERKHHVQKVYQFMTSGEKEKGVRLEAFFQDCGLQVYYVKGEKQ